MAVAPALLLLEPAADDDCRDCVESLRWQWGLSCSWCLGLVCAGGKSALQLDVPCMPGHAVLKPLQLCLVLHGAQDLCSSSLGRTRL